MMARHPSVPNVIFSGSIKPLFIVIKAHTPRPARPIELNEEHGISSVAVTQTEPRVDEIS